jgi:hypothetical protein
MRVGGKREGCVNFGQYECRGAEEGIGSDWNTKRMVHIPGTGGPRQRKRIQKHNGWRRTKGEGNERSLSEGFSGLLTHVGTSR